MRDAITKRVKTYYAIVVTSDGKQETYQVPQRQFQYDDESLLRYLQRQAEMKLVKLERRFIKSSAYWMSTEDFLKYAEKGEAVTSPSGSVKIRKLKKGVD